MDKPETYENNFNIEETMIARGIDKSRARLFSAYYDLLIDRNSRMNLTAITKPEEVVEKHFFDSLLALPFIEHGAKCIDIGSGAGFPGIPLKIMRPDIELVMIDSLNKRVNFLREVIELLGFTPDTCRAEHMRAEEAGAITNYREAFDVALTRAVANTGALVEWSAPFLRVGGMAILYKGTIDSSHSELDSAKTALKTLHMQADIKRVDVEWGERSLIICKKLNPTPPRFPRKPGEALRKPL